MMNMHYTYFSSKTTPMDIINKYRMRGYGIILNTNEIKELYKYSCENEFWRNLYDISSQTFTNSIKMFTGYYLPIHRFFKPRYINMAFFIDDDYVELEYNEENVSHNNQISFHNIFTMKNLIIHTSKYNYYDIKFPNGNLEKLDTMIIQLNKN